MTTVSLTPVPVLAYPIILEPYPAVEFQWTKEKWGQVILFLSQEISYLNSLSLVSLSLSLSRFLQSIFLSFPPQVLNN